MRKELCSVAELRKEMSYAPETGRFYWADSGLEARVRYMGGNYPVISGVGGSVQYSARRMAWALHYGVWPQFRLICLDARNYKDLRIENIVRDRISRRAFHYL